MSHAVPSSVHDNRAVCYLSSIILAWPTKSPSNPTGTPQSPLSFSFSISISARRAYLEKSPPGIEAKSTVRTLTLTQTSHLSTFTFPPPQVGSISLDDPSENDLTTPVGSPWTSGRHWHDHHDEH